MASARKQLLMIGKLPPHLKATLEVEYDLIDRARLSRLASGFPVAITTSMDGASAATMDAIPDLKLIACNGAGLDAIDLAAAEQRGIVVRNTPDAVTQDTAEFAISLILTLGRRVIDGEKFIRAGHWGPQRMTVGHRVWGRTLGIVGMGRIGKQIAATATALGMKVRYNARSQKPELPYPFDADVLKLANASDMLVLALSVGPGAQKIVDASVLAALGPNGLLINIARGSAVDEDVLIKALREKKIGGAALDVFASEPALNPEFLTLDNVVLTPHMAAVTEETRQAMADQIRQAADEYFQTA